MTVVLCLPSPAARREKASASLYVPPSRPLGCLRRGPSRAAGFTLPELLIVVGIIAVLLAILLPSIVAARNRAKAVMCLSNVRQLCLGMSAYASDFKNWYPPAISTPAPGLYWYDDGRVATYVSTAGSSSGGTASGTGGVFVCPSDDDAGRSYSMNYWATSARSGITTTGQGKYFMSTVGQPSKMILVVESWSSLRPNPADGWVAQAIVGANGTPGQRFGGGKGLTAPVPTRGSGAGALRSGSELPFSRHRGRAIPGAAAAVKGSVSIGYADGHVDMRSDTDLVQPNGLSSLDSLWSPYDPDFNQ